MIFLVVIGWLLWFCLTLLLTAVGVAVIVAGGIVFGVSRLFVLNRPPGFENAGMRVGRGLWQGGIAATDRLNRRGQFRRR